MTITGIRRWLADHFAMLAAVAALLYLFLPVAYTFAFSFNDHGRSNIVWQGFTLEHWRDPCGVPGACASLVTSLQVATLSTLVATVLGTMMALAMVRYRYRGRSASNMLVFVPMATPEIVLGAAMLAFSLSFDDFIITNFVSGNESTFPKFVYVASRRGIPAEANVIGFSMFVIAVLLVVGAQGVSSVRASKYKS